MIRILVLSFIQNVSFSILSRSRNRNNMTYHMVAAVFSNLIWFATMRELILADMTADLALPYTAGTVAGSVVGVKVSQIIERWLRADSDSHINKQSTIG